MLLDLAFLIPAFPLLGFLTIFVLGRKMGEPMAGWVATLAMGGSFNHLPAALNPPEHAGLQPAHLGFGATRTPATLECDWTWERSPT